MFGTANFINCINEQMEKRGFGEKRRDEIVDRFKGIRENLVQSGFSGDPDLAAMQRVFNEVHEAAQTKARLEFSNAQKNARNVKTLENFNRNTGILTANNEKANHASALIGFIEDSPLVPTVGVLRKKDNIRGLLASILGDDFDNVNKGMFGIQRGDVHLPNIEQELFGKDTGDAIAKQLAQSWRKMTDTAVKLFNDAGGAMKHLQGWNLPQGLTAARVAGTTADDFVKFMMDKMDWVKTTHPNGSAIRPGEREAVLRDIYATTSTDGAIKIDPEKYGGQGNAIGNALEDHRFMHFKDADSYQAVMKQYADGNFYDRMVHYIEHMSRQIALIDTFGSNPEAGMEFLKLSAQKLAAQESPKAASAAKGEIAKFDKMADSILHKNGMDPNSKLGAYVAGTSNVLAGAQLASASLLAIPGDFMTTMVTRVFNGMNANPFGVIGKYMGNIITGGGWQESMLRRSGFIYDSALTSFMGTTRFGMMQTNAPAITRRISDFIMRASFMSGHTDMLRGINQLEIMGFLHDLKNTEFDKLPINAVLNRYGVTPEMWDRFRGLASHEPEPGVQLLRPIDAVPSGDMDIYHAFQGMIHQESLHMVPGSTLEASVSLRDTTRPDTLAGTVLHSFASYKNFPLTMINMYGRLAMSNSERSGRLAMIAGLGAGLTMMGALGVQMKELVKGNDPMPMNTLGFWGKAMLSGGAMGIWGDFMFSHVNDYGHSVSESFAGPLAGLLQDTTQLAFGEPFKWVSAMDKGSTLKPDAFGARAVQFASRYTPGSNLWWARLALQREVWDRLTELSDPQAYKKFNERLKKQRKNTGNDAWWAQGTDAPSRAPSFTGG